MPHTDTTIDDSIRELGDFLVDIVNDDEGKKPERLAKLFEDYKSYLKSNVTINDDQHQNVLPAKLQAMVAAMVRADPSQSEEQHLHTLLHTAHGRRLAEHLNSLSKSTPTTKEHPMSRIDELKAIAKADGGMNSIIEHVISKGSTTYTEHELTEVGMEYCKSHRKDGESAAQAFARYVEATPEFGRALHITRGF